MKHPRGGCWDHWHTHGQLKKSGHGNDRLLRPPSQPKRRRLERQKTRRHP